MLTNKEINTDTQNTRSTGDIGENVAVKYLKNKGFFILDRNYGDKWGELDIVAKNKGIVHFVEVKALSYDSLQALEEAIAGESWRPEEQVHAFKLKQIGKMAEIWIAEHGYTGDFQIGVIAVRMVAAERYAAVNHI